MIAIGERGWGWGKIRSLGLADTNYIKWITNKNLWYSTENSTQYSAMTYMEKKIFKSVCVCVCV